MPMLSVEWAHNAERLLLPIAVLAPTDAENSYDSGRVEGLIDTSATKTGIRGDVAKRLGLKPKGQRRVETANGSIWASEYLSRIGLVSGNYRNAIFDPTMLQPFVFGRHLTGFEL